MKWYAGILVVAVLLLNYRIWISDDGLSEVRRLERSVAAQQSTNATLVRRNEQLAAEVADLKGGLVAIEERARSELGMVALGWRSSPLAASVAASPIPDNLSNTAALGQILYTKYAVFFEASAMVLLTAMIGAIVLTLHHRPNVKRQSIEEQNSRNAKNVVEIKKVPFRTGV